MRKVWIFGANNTFVGEERGDVSAVATESGALVVHNGGDGVMYAPGRWSKVVWWAEESE